MLPSSHGRPAGEGDVPRTRRREATAGRAAVAARAPRRGAAMAQDEYDSGGARVRAALIVIVAGLLVVRLFLAGGNPGM